MNIKSFIGLLLFFIFSNGFADDLPGQIKQLGEISIDAVKDSDVDGNAPVKVEYVTKEEIEKTHARDLKEAIEHVTGVQIKGITGKSGSQVWLQGMNGDRVLVVINGEPIAASTGSTVDLSQVGVLDIERIEIIKGATSALYGNSAMGGVVNIITRKPSQPLEWQISADGGSFGEKNLGEKLDITSRHYQGRVSVASDTGYAQMVLDVRDNDGFTLDHSTISTEGESGLKGNLNTRFAWTPDDNTEFYFAPSYYKEDIQNYIEILAPGAGPNGENIIPGQRVELADRLHTSLGVHKKFTDGDGLDINLMHEEFNDSTQRDALTTEVVEQDRIAKVTMLRADVSVEQAVSDKHTLSYGAVTQSEELTQDLIVNQASNLRIIPEITDQAERKHLEAFIQDDVFVSDEWEVLVGMRALDDADFGTFYAPKLNVAYVPYVTNETEWLFRGGVGIGYRTPNIREQYFIFDHSALGYMILGNPDLTEERSESYQLGMKLTRPDDYSVDLGLFRNNIENYIETVVDEQQSIEKNITIFVYQNIGRARTEGAELTIEKNISTGLKVKTAYTLLDAVNLETGKDLARSARHQINLGVDYQINDRLDVLLRGSYQSKEYIDDDNLLVSPEWNKYDIKFNWQFSKQTRLYFGVNNITDETRGPVDVIDLATDFRPVDGRMIYAGFSLEGVK